MAPSNPTPGNTTVSQSFNGNDFFNNLFTDLTPVLTLFGEQVTKQFLSLSMGWPDSLLISVFPIGILTIVVSAIRVGGSDRLKSLIGRAREPKAEIEVDVLSSTSEEVCELWDGDRIVRVQGKSDTVECVIAYGPKEQIDFIHFPNHLRPPEETKDCCYIKGTRASSTRSKFFGKLKSTMDRTSHALSKMLVVISRDRVTPFYLSSQLQKIASILHEGPLSKNFGRRRQTFIEEPFPRELTCSPNLILNIHGALPSKFESKISGFLGILVQLSILVVAGLDCYLYHWILPSRGPLYSFPCFLVGTLGLSMGMFICGHVVDAATYEATMEPQRDSDRNEIQYQPLRIQPACRIGEKKFPPCAIYNDADDDQIRVSRQRTGQDQQITTSIGAGLSALGYAAQFIGLRGLPWYIAVMQLSCTIILTLIRSWLRRGLSRRPCVMALNNQASELGAMKIARRMLDLRYYKIPISAESVAEFLSISIEDTQEDNSVRNNNRRDSVPSEDFSSDNKHHSSTSKLSLGCFRLAKSISRDIGDKILFPDTCMNLANLMCKTLALLLAENDVVLYHKDQIEYSANFNTMLSSFGEKDLHRGNCVIKFRPMRHESCHFTEGPFNDYSYCRYNRGYSHYDCIVNLMTLFHVPPEENRQQCKILGQASNSMNLKRWLPTYVLDSELTETTLRQLLRREDLKSSLIVGLYLLPRFNQRGSKDVERRSNDPYNIEDSILYCPARSTWLDGSKSSTSAQIFAQAIFGTFLTEILDNVKCIKQRPKLFTRREYDPKYLPERIYTLDFISSIKKLVIDSGITGSHFSASWCGEADSFIIPIFAAHGLLPELPEPQESSEVELGEIRD